MSARSSWSFSVASNYIEVYEGSHDIPRLSDIILWHACIQNLNNIVEHLHLELYHRGWPLFLLQLIDNPHRYQAPASNRCCHYCCPIPSAAMPMMIPKGRRKEGTYSWCSMILWTMREVLTAHIMMLS